LLTPDVEVHAQLRAAFSSTCRLLERSELQTTTADPHTPGVAVLSDERGAETLLALFAQMQLRWPLVRAVALLSTRDPRTVAALEPLRGSLLVKPFDTERLLAAVRHHIHVSRMNSGVRCLNNASAIMRLMKMA
jgi:hypothetical protein